MGQNGRRQERRGRGEREAEGKGKEETAGRYSFAVPAVVIYLKPLAVNISPSLIQGQPGASSGGSSGGKGEGGGGEGRGCKLCVPSYLGERGALYLLSTYISTLPTHLKSYAGADPRASRRRYLPAPDGGGYRRFCPAILPAQIGARIDYAC